MERILVGALVAGAVALGFWLWIGGGRHSSRTPDAPALASASASAGNELDGAALARLAQEPPW
jgi:hypothetical protein